MAAYVGQTVSSRYCLLLVFGIPGIGKSSLVKELLSRTDIWQPSSGTPSPHSEPTQYVHVCFDDFYPTDKRESHMSAATTIDSESPSFNWKQQRSVINSNIEKCLMINGSGDFNTDNSDGLWEGFKQKLCDRNNDSVNTRIQENGRFSCDRTVIIIDDNLPLRSMRYEYNQMARKYLCGFCEVMLSCDLSTALLWNQDRPNPVPSHTVTTMASTLEAPQPDKYHWERKSLAMKTDSWWKDDRWNEICCSIYELCECAMNDPVTPYPVEDPLVKKESRLVTASNQTHQVDQKLRECVSSVITKCKDSKVSANEVAQVAKFANELRKQILEEFRHAGVGHKANIIDTLSTIEQKFYLLYSNKSHPQ